MNQNTTTDTTQTAAPAPLPRTTTALLADQRGLSTIEYAMGTLAAAALAAVLYLVVNSDAVTDAIEGIITDALSRTPA